ncbi:pyruvate kinase [Candidatus Desantisbacteria bacterium CG1_02_38_46]|uniref:Pyruvate kinase n=3 Tax=unclassified Candidatus Desantisiibacteriota TaxID=3106372 RepID=A0A2H9PEH7_9BACT|nr:MAG: pyruvate kinase [Candidatus Desantisbacteria bacterium CG1_02_38_46]PIZ17242.1 MAG: pyruvate kinase [Candidatus Desantisbacteria bacterium CG_4_10_14_0_8_um_filter_39_17]
MCKTKIICTIGPASEKPTTIEKMIKSGMDIARLNFSHGTHEQHGEHIVIIRKASNKLSKYIGIMQDLQGPKIRIGKFKPGIKNIVLQPGEKFILTTENCSGDRNRVNVDYKKLHGYLAKDDRIFLDDGKIELLVKKVNNRNIESEVIIGGELSERKGVSLPDKPLPSPLVTQYDINDLNFGMKLGVNYVAVSFTRKKENILKIRNLLRNNNEISLIAKIEDAEGLNNIDSIIDVSDGIMIARGDLGVCIPRAEVPLIQKEIIRKCRKSGKPVIVATQMLDSMTTNPHPTRAEVNDVANGVLDGADCLMLSAETSVGKYPVEAVQEISSIINTVENSTDYRRTLTSEEFYPQERGLIQGLGIAIDKLSQVDNVKVIICLTKTGNTAKIISQYRPQLPIIAVTVNKTIAMKLLVYWGIKVLIGKKVKDVEQNYKTFVKHVRREGLVNEGDIAIITSGIKEKPFQANISVVEV